MSKKINNLNLKVNKIIKEKNINQKKNGCEQKKNVKMSKKCEVNAKGSHFLKQKEKSYD